MTVNMDLESTPGRMAASTRVIGITVNSTATAFTDKRMVVSAVAVGTRASEATGLTSRRIRKFQATTDTKAIKCD